MAAASAHSIPDETSAASIVEWRISDEPVGYADAVADMERRVAAIRTGTAPELIWLLEHPPLYTAGTSARESDLLEPGLLPVHRTGRGGQYTYHGPGQRVAYVMLDLKRRGTDVRCFVSGLEEWMIRTLARVAAFLMPDDHHCAAIEARHSAGDRCVVAKTPVAM